MDKEEARFILRCFRPDGADAENGDFAEALGWAAKDRELGEWLAQERARDAAFAQALGDLALPAALREEILSSLEWERGARQIVPDALDHAAMGALANMTPPVRLRSEVLAAMARTVQPKRPWWTGWRFGFPMAAAAGITLALVFFPHRPELSESSAQGPTVDDTPGRLVPASTTLTIGAVERNSIQVLETDSPVGGPQMAITEAGPFDPVNHDQELPCPSRCLPEGLRKIPGVNCRALTIDGKKGVLVCYKEEERKVHLVVFKRCDVKCRLPDLDHPAFDKDGKWVVAKWADENWVYMLLGGDDVAYESLRKLF